MSTNILQYMMSYNHFLRDYCRWVSKSLPLKAGYIFVGKNVAKVGTGRMDPKEQLPLLDIFVQ